MDCWCTPKGWDEIIRAIAVYGEDKKAFDELAHAKKLTVEHEALDSDVNRLTQLFVELRETTATAETTRVQKYGERSER